MAIGNVGPGGFIEPAIWAALPYFISPMVFP